MQVLPGTFNRPAIQRNAESWAEHAEGGDKERFERVLNTVQTVTASRQTPDKYADFVSNTLAKINLADKTNAENGTDIPAQTLRRASFGGIPKGKTSESLNRTLASNPAIWTHVKTRAALDKRPNNVIPKPTISRYPSSTFQESTQEAAESSQHLVGNDDVEGIKRPQSAPYGRPSGLYEVQILNQRQGGSRPSSGNSGTRSRASSARRAVSREVDDSEAQASPPDPASLEQASHPTSTYHDSYDFMRSCYPELYDYIVEQLAPVEVPKYSVTSEWAESRKKGNQYFPTNYTTAYAAANFELYPRSEKTGAEVIKEREFFKWLTKQKLYYGDLFEKDKAKDVENLLKHISAQKKVDGTKAPGPGKGHASRRRSEVGDPVAPATQGPMPAPSTGQSHRVSHAERPAMPVADAPSVVMGSGLSVASSLPSSVSGSAFLHPSPALASSPLATQRSPRQSPVKVPLKPPHLPETGRPNGSSLAAASCCTPPPQGAVADKTSVAGSSDASFAGGRTVRSVAGSGTVVAAWGESVPSTPDDERLASLHLDEHVTKEECVATLRQLHAAVDPDQYKSHSQVVHNYKAPIRDASHHRELQEYIHIRNNGFPRPRSSRSDGAAANTRKTATAEAGADRTEEAKFRREEEERDAKAYKALEKKGLLKKSVALSSQRSNASSVPLKWAASKGTFPKSTYKEAFSVSDRDRSYSEAQENPAAIAQASARRLQGSFAIGAVDERLAIACPRTAYPVPLSFLQPPMAFPPPSDKVAKNTTYRVTFDSRTPEDVSRAYRATSRQSKYCRKVLASSKVPLGPGGPELSPKAGWVSETADSYSERHIQAAAKAARDTYQSGRVLREVYNAPTASIGAVTGMRVPGMH